jgi:ABC-2 type transport system permease protein
MYILRVFFTIIKYLYRAKFEYPGAYIGGIVTQWVSYGTFMFMMFLMVWNFGTLAGWLPAEVMFLYGTFLLTYALGATFTFTLCVNFSQISINGTLDEAYTRPVPPFIYLLATHFNTGYISHISLTAVVLGLSISHLGLSWTALQWLWFVVVILNGAVITACMMLICDMPAIRTRSQSPTGMFFWQMREFNQYPITIYPRIIQYVFTVILPFGFISFYPIQVLLGKQDGLLPHVNMWLSPLVATLLVGITALCWRLVSSRYESAGT